MQRPMPSCGKVWCLCKQNDCSWLAASQIYTALPVVQTARPPVRCCDVPTHPILPHAHAYGPCSYPCEPCHGLVLLHSASDGCAEPANHHCWPRPRHTGRMADRYRRRADCPFQTAEVCRQEERSRQEEEVVGEVGSTASRLAGRTHAYPLTVARNGSSTAVNRTLRENDVCFGQYFQVLPDTAS
jgi:hypothetical protein